MHGTYHERTNSLRKSVFLFESSKRGEEEVEEGKKNVLTLAGMLYEQRRVSETAKRGISAPGGTMRNVSYKKCFVYLRSSIFSKVTSPSPRTSNASLCN
jgi:hypothetical protein